MSREEVSSENYFSTVVLKKYDFFEVFEILWGWELILNWVLKKYPSFVFEFFKISWGLFFQYLTLGERICGRDDGF